MPVERYHPINLSFGMSLCGQYAGPFAHNRQCCPAVTRLAAISFPSRLTWSEASNLIVGPGVVRVDRATNSMSEDTRS